MLNKLANKGLTVSVIVGTMLVPLTALAALWLSAPAPTTEEMAATSSTTTVTTVPVIEGAVDISADLQRACGPEGRQLVSLEESGNITAVQQAALDALREVCQQRGIPLPSHPAAEPVLQTIVIPARTAVASNTPATVAGSDHESEHHEDEDHEDDEHEHEDDHDRDHGEHEDDD